MASEIPLHARVDRALSFGGDAEQYDRARPSYPDALVDRLIEGGATSVLDVGCGTGIASRQFAARGCRVLGVEPDARMAAIATASGIKVDVERFEAWDAAGRQFDLVCSAQAWHWIDPDLGIARAAGVLVSGGAIAVFWNVGHPEDDVRHILDACYRRAVPGFEEPSVLRGGHASSRFVTTREAIAGDDRLARAELESFSHVVSYTTAEWLALLGTHSDHRNLEPDVRSALFSEISQAIDSLGGGLDLTYETVCVSALRRYERSARTRRHRASSGDAAG